MTDRLCKCGHLRSIHLHGEECGSCDCDLWRDPWEEFIKAIVDKAPPLTAEQRDRLSLIFRNPAG